ncbi:MAG: methyltransferase [Candidatus Riflebacteria bacterium]|nr:methyltransferase [Candidatus Riflebacteria bacterium]
MMPDYNEIPMDVDERLDTIPGTDFALIQKIDGTAFSIDSIMLADFVQFNPDIDFVADLGSGSGILAFLLKYRARHIHVTGFEVQPEMHALSLRNIQMNPQFSGIAFDKLDIRNIPSKILPETFDLVVSNPPYFKSGSGKLSPKSHRAAARHELHGTLENFVEAANYMLGYGGKFCVVIPVTRFVEILEFFKKFNFGLKRMRYLLPKEEEKAHLVLLEAERFYNGKHYREPDLPIHMKDSSFSPYLQNLFENGFRKYPFSESMTRK